MSPICLSAERCGGEDSVTATQVEPRPQEGQIKGAVHFKPDTDPLSRYSPPRLPPHLSPGSLKVQFQFSSILVSYMFS